MIFAAERALYFAYGSNMSSSWLKRCVRSAKVIGPATLEGYSWCCNKLGKDGTAKANIMQVDDDAVHGVLYEIKAKHWKQLDRIESGYKRVELEVNCGGEVKMASTYISDLLTANAPSPEYISIIIDGLQEHGIDMVYVSRIRREAGI